MPANATKWPKHLYQDSEGLLPDRLNKWETATLKEEMARDDFIGWLRNRERQSWALCIPYKHAGVWKGCYPDFLIFRRKDNCVVVDIIDPHLTSIEGSPLKAAALAWFADEHQDSFGRIDLIVVDRPDKPDEQVKRLLTHGPERPEKGHVRFHTATSPRSLRVRRLSEIAIPVVFRC